MVSARVNLSKLVKMHVQCVMFDRHCICYVCWTSPCEHMFDKTSYFALIAVTCIGFLLQVRLAHTHTQLQL